MEAGGTEIYLQFTRSFNLYLAEFWRSPLITPNVKKFMGVGLSDHICYYDGDTQYYYRIKPEMQALKGHVLSLKPGDRRYSEGASRLFREKVKRMRILMERNIPDKNIPRVYREAKKLFEELYPFYYFGYFMGGPWKAEYGAIWGKRAEKTLKLQYGNRVYSEGLLKQFSNFIENLCMQKIGDLSAELDISLLKFREVEALLLKDEVPNIKHVKRRENGYVLVRGKVIETDDFLATINRFGYHYRPKEIEETMNLEGEIAYLAKPVVGKARVILNDNDLKKFMKGEVMVAPMTQPMYLPQMKLAKAIVTDEGEITCHAAIASRKLRIPCVIGTNSASQLLRDGDLVEVDAKKGLVKKIS
ncbi:MAG: PEP-utilizing enzyme [Candidatus Micrarchaeota archaeon]